MICAQSFFGLQVRAGVGRQARGQTGGERGNSACVIARLAAAAQIRLA